MTGQTFTAKQKLDCIRREIDKRNRVFPRLVAEGKMTRGFAAEQIAIMHAVADDYVEQAEKERLL